MKFLALLAFFITQFSLASELKCSSKLMRLSVQFTEQGKSLTAKLERRETDKTPAIILAKLSGKLVPQTIVQTGKYRKVSYDLEDSKGDNGVLTFVKQYKMMATDNTDLAPRKVTSVGLTYKSYLETFDCE